MQEIPPPPAPFPIPHCCQRANVRLGEFQYPERSFFNTTVSGQIQHEGNCLQSIEEGKL